MTIRAAVLALALAMPTTPVFACGAITACDVGNGWPIDDIAGFWHIVRNSPDPETAVTRVKAKFGSFPIDFAGDDHKHGGAYAHVVIIGLKTDGVSFYSQAPVANVDVSILAPTFSSSMRRIVQVTVGGNLGAPMADSVR